MNNKDLYKGINPIYESMKHSMMEDKEKGNDKSVESMDSISIVSTALNTFFSILLNSKMENAKTVRGFQEIKNKILGSNNFGSFRQYLISVLDSLSAMDPSQKEAYQKNIQFIKDTLAKTEASLSDTKIFDSIKKDTVSKLLVNFEEDLKEREAQMKKTNPKLFGEVVKQGLVVKEEKILEEEGEEADEEFRGRAFNKSKESLDAATALVGMIDRDKYVAVLKDNADVKRYEEIAQNLLKRAQELQMIDRKGLRNIVTPSGEYKRKDYVRQQDSLINDIIRQKKEYERIKEGVLKQGGLTPPPVVVPVCPPGKVYDPGKGICVSTGEEDSTSGGEQQAQETKPTTDCKFPVSLKSKCNQVGELQAKLMEIIPSVKEYLSKKGGADKIYGKGTAAVSNIVWGYLSGNTGQDLTSSLTEEMYKSIMALTADDIDTTTTAIVGAAIKDNKNWEMSISQKIQEREEIKGAPILSFEDFYSVIEESYSFQKMDEDGEPKSIGDAGPPPVPSKKLKDSCIKDSIAQGKVLPCVAGATGDTGDAGETGTKPPTREEWKGLKYVNTGSYPVAFDESLLSAWGKEIAITAISFAIPGSGYLAKAGSTALRGLSIRGAERVGAEKLAQRLSVGAAEGTLKGTSQQLVGKTGRALSGAALKSSAKANPSKVANALSRLSSEFFTKYKAIPIPKRTSAGLIGGTVGGGVADFLAGRNSYIITVTEGFIERSNLLGVVTGLVDTLDGYVSDDDWATIAQVAAVIKGSWTIDEDGKQISSWAFIKDKYQSKEGEGLVEDINSVSAKMGDVEGFPKLKSADPMSSESEIDWDFARTELVDFIGKLDSNESKIKENLQKLPKDYVEAFEEGSFAEYDEEGNIEGMDLEGESEE